MWSALQGSFFFLEKNGTSKKKKESETKATSVIFWVITDYIVRKHSWDL